MLNWDKKDSYLDLVQALQDDKVVLASSDTVLGLFAQLSEKAKLRLDIVKKRNLKPYIILLQSALQIHEFTDQDLDPAMQKIIATYWPGPLTIIFKAKSSLPSWMIGSQQTVAIRIPYHTGLQKLLESVPALFTTSANISDQPVPHTYTDVAPEILQQVAAVCCEHNAMYDGPASTIVDYSSGSIKIVRVGAICVDSIWI